MDHLMDPVHGPPWTSPWTWSMDQVPWTIPNFQKEITPVNFIWKFTEGQGMKNKDSYLLLTFLAVCRVKASCFGIAAPWMGRPQTRFEIQKIYCISTANIFIPTLSNCNSIGKTPPPPAYYTLSCIKIRRLFYKRSLQYEHKFVIKAYWWKNTSLCFLYPDLR